MKDIFISESRIFFVEKRKINNEIKHKIKTAGLLNKLYFFLLNVWYRNFFNMIQMYNMKEKKYTYLEEL